MDVGGFPPFETVDAAFCEPVEMRHARGSLAGVVCGTCAVSPKEGALRRSRETQTKFVGLLAAALLLLGGGVTGCASSSDDEKDGVPDLERSVFGWFRDEPSRAILAPSNPGWALELRGGCLVLVRDVDDGRYQEFVVPLFSDLSRPAWIENGMQWNGRVRQLGSPVIDIGVDPTTSVSEWRELFEDDVFIPAACSKDWLAVRVC